MEVIFFGKWPYMWWVTIFYCEGGLIFESYICGSLYSGWLIVGVGLLFGRLIFERWRLYSGGVFQWGHIIGV